MVLTYSRGTWSHSTKMVIFGSSTPTGAGNTCRVAPVMTGPPEPVSANVRLLTPSALRVSMALVVVVRVHRRASFAGVSANASGRNRTALYERYRTVQSSHR